MSDSSTIDIRHLVLINREGQYSIWPSDRDVPHGWKDVGKHGTKIECLSYVKDVWTDMRPASLRERTPGEESPSDKHGPTLRNSRP